MAKDEGPIRDLKLKLTSRGHDTSGDVVRSPLRSREYEVASDWEHDHDPQDTSAMKKRPKNKLTFATKFFIAAVIFFVVSGALALFLIGSGSNTISTRNVDIAVSGPVSIAGGSVFTLQIDITNRNRTPLQTADLALEFPEGTRDPQDPSKALPRFRELLGDIAPGESVSKSIDVLLFGEAGSDKEITIAVEYRVPDSNAIFVKERQYGLSINSAPLTVLVDIPAEINTGQTFPIEVELASNAGEVIEDVLFEIDYPFGFTFVASTPEPVFADNLWNLGDIEPQSRRRIVLEGRIEGEDKEERTFRFSGGIQSPVNEHAIATPFIQSTRSVTIARPFLALDLTLGGGRTNPYVLRGGEDVRADLTLQNNLPSKVLDAEIVVTLRGDALDETSVLAPGGFYRSGDNTILWDASSVPELSEIAPGEERRVSFSFSPREAARQGELRNPEIVIEIVTRAGQFGDTAVSGPVSSDLSRTVHIASNARISGRAVHFVGPFANIGPIPPRVDTETTFTIVWSIINPTNDISDTVVRAQLPPYVRFLNAVDPATQNLSYNASGGEVTWNAGTISAGSGIDRPAREVAFQVAMTPSVIHVGEHPPLIGQTQLSAFDTFTRIELAATSREINTRLSTDPQFPSFGTEVVN